MMKKALKITGITLASLVGLVLIAIFIALGTVTSPKRLTKMVKKYVPQYVDFDMALERANLTLKTFPDIGLELDQVAILSPMTGAPTDTLAKVGKLILSADAKKFLQEKEIVVKRCLLDDAMVSIFTDAEGHSNLDIFSSNSDDTTSKPFDYSIDLHEVKLTHTDVSYTDLSQKMTAQAEELNLDIKGQMQDQDIQAVLALNTDRLTLKTNGLDTDLKALQIDFNGSINDFQHINGLLKLASPDTRLLTGYEVLRHDRLSLELPLNLHLKPINGSLSDALIHLNDYHIALTGNASMEQNGDIGLDLKFNTNTLDLEEVISYLPENIITRLRGITFKGKAELNEGSVKGIINDSLLPVIVTKVTIHDSEVNVPQLPYPFKQVALSTLLDLNLNESLHAKDIQLNTLLNRSKITLTGDLTDLANKMYLNLNLKSNLVMADLKPFLPKNITIGGKTQVKMNLKSSLDDFLNAVTKYKFSTRLKADADLVMNDFSFQMDSTQALSPKMNLKLTLPASRAIKGRNGAFIGLNSDVLNAQMGKTLDANLEAVKMEGNVDQLSGGIDKILSNISLEMGKLKMNYDSIHVDAKSPTITLETTPGKNKGINAIVSLKSQDLNANAGTSYTLNTHALSLHTTVKENPTKSEPLDRWNPTADFVLTNAVCHIAGLDETMTIPTIDFLLNKNELGFRRGTVKLGQSDLTLEGNVIGIDQWMKDHKNLMKAELQVTSNYLNINEIMDLTSGLGVAADSTVTAAEEKTDEDNPFMVPEGIDFSFGIRAKKALYGNFDLNDLGGTATVKDGTLLLREIGFTNEAAEMQLTAMYQSPRKNNLFLGLDFHLLNVQIYDLLHMIPEIDTIVPMLKTFDGAAEFHIAAQTNLKSNYELKMSTLRASADIEGANLNVKDITAYTKITDMLKVSTNGEYKVDSIDIQMTAFRNEVDLWPFQVCLGKYKATIDGHYNLNTIGEYHISVTDSPLPTRLGLKISGPLNNLNYKLESCKYPNLYRPARRNDTEKMVMELKRMIAERLKENVL